MKNMSSINKMFCSGLQNQFFHKVFLNVSITTGKYGTNDKVFREFLVLSAEEFCLFL